MSLELRRAGYRWPGGALALDDATIGLEPGRVLAILGPNGAGKSTLLGLASGRLEPSGGEALLDGKAIRAWERRALARRLAHLPQVERLAFNYPVLDFVLLGRAPHVPSLAQPGPADLERAAAALAELGLSALADRPVAELSGGELQLVRLARCLAQEAAYLLLDEPSTMLDPANARRLADELKRLAESGR
ncbi:MAG: ABC transporter ATP-binding protein, partial [Spirochaetaceae bacterium]|nr:ABC transporter ATP-binding protein [Spirochaetaceae bacterium]